MIKEKKQNPKNAKKQNPKTVKKMSLKQAKKLRAKRIKQIRKANRFRPLYVSLTLCFVILSLLIIANHYFGGDSKSIVLIGCNPILKSISYTEFGLNIISKGPIIAANTVAGSISIYWYIAHLVTFALYGAVLDVIQGLIKRLIHSVKEQQAKAREAEEQLAKEQEAEEQRANELKLKEQKAKLQKAKELEAQEKMAKSQAMRELQNSEQEAEQQQ